MTAVLRMIMNAGKSIANPFAVRPYIRPKTGDCAADGTMFVRDMRVVGRDVGRVVSRELKKHGK